MAPVLGIQHSCTVTSAAVLALSSAKMISQQVYLSCKHVNCRSSYAHSPTRTVMQAEKDKGMFCWHGSNAAKLKMK